MEKTLGKNKITNWNDFLSLECSEKAILSSNSVKDNLAVKEGDIAYYYFSGGTTGKPKTIPVTNMEWKNRNEYRAECYRLAGLTKYDSVWVALPFGPWSAGHSVQQAFQIVGSNIMPAGLINRGAIIKHIWKQAKMMNINVVASTPSMFNCIEKMINQDDFFPINKVVVTGERVTDCFRNYYKSKYGIDTIASYGSSECFFGIECRLSCGYHYDPTRVFIEVVDENGLPTNQEGSLLVTNTQSEAIPLIRYKIGDRGRIIWDRCSCGSKWPRIKWTGREESFYELAGGANFYKHQIEEALLKMKKRIYRCKVLISDGKSGKDKIKFTLYYRDEIDEKIRRLNFLNQAKDIIQNMSLDFRDVIFGGFVTLEVKSIKVKDVFLKTKVEIEDKRFFKK